MDDLSIPTSGPEWHKFRGQGIGSSDASILMDSNPWRTIQHLWDDKMGLGEPIKDNWAMARGRELEPFARDLYNDLHSANFQPRNFIYKHWEKARSSSDGYDATLGYSIEIKTPGKADIALAKNGKIPTKYQAQVQWLMLTSCTHILDYVTLDTTVPIYDIIVVRVEEDLKYQRELLRRAKWFWHKIENKIPLSLRKARCIKF